jgi:FKBP12-rapamycin complex-associated protein
MEVVSEILDRILILGVTDTGLLYSMARFTHSTEPSVRIHVLSSLDHNFDHHLAQSEHIRTLVMSVNDEIFSVRNLAVSVLGRLISHNPAYVMPPLRKTLIQLLTDLEYSGIRYAHLFVSVYSLKFSRQKEESVQLVASLISSSSIFVKPYVEPILKVFVAKLNDQNSSLTSKLLFGIGELSLIDGYCYKGYLETLLPLLLDALVDQSNPSRREAALKALGQIVGSTGWVIEPYLKYPPLLTTILGIVRTEQNACIRQEAVKCLGILGALDPYKFKVFITLSD